MGVFFFFLLRLEGFAEKNEGRRSQKALMLRGFALMGFAKKERSAIVIV